LKLNQPSHEIEETVVDKPADYRITVQGVIPVSWLDRLGGLRIATVANGKTTLEGPLLDQAALKGVLDTLYDLRLCLEELTQGKETLPMKNPINNRRKRNPLENHDRVDDPDKNTIQ